ncbi:nuclear transport factor 2 family protein [Novosphingobium sp. G106]|uniref:nuclear transport factor 2 family protein n=1 Tax=Novosphingobium sp. G106 TaxID=2849500 RepID=UPI001C2CCCF0|nr:nuclear transport factor 2 family protein [Novosphingobium sp. G106]MBV1690515.1 nuclear transport factor 2 family protein [Novosphingobium sp. G106]
MTLSPTEVADKLEIADKIYRYCRSVDRLDVPVGHSVFHADSVADFGESYVGTGRGWIDFICEEHKKFLYHSHQVTNVIIELSGETAGSESYVYASLQRQDGDKVVQHEFWARYVDKWSKRGGDWAIDRRDCIVDYGVIREVTQLPGNPASRRDRDDPSYDVLTRS